MIHNHKNFEIGAVNQLCQLWATHLLQHNPLKATQTAEAHLQTGFLFFATDRLRLLFLASENIIEMLWEPEFSLSEMFNGKLKFRLRSDLILESGQRCTLS